MSRRALLSVSDKTGLIEFAGGLLGHGFEIYSTGGTLAALKAGGVPARTVSELTGFPEIMDGRVKTLHPAIHAGILARRDRPEHMSALEDHGFGPIDLVCVNLYPFAATAARADATPEEIVEQVDIGGPAMLRAAAKNHESVLVVVHPSRYKEVLDALAAGGQSLADLRRRLAAEAFSHTAAYDSQVASWLQGHAGDFPEQLTVTGNLVQRLRYGENPHQQGAFYSTGLRASGLAAARQLQGVELSYNNIQDSAAALAMVAEFARPAAAIIKHMNPCGLALGETLVEAYRRAYECDPTSAFGGVVALNRELDTATAAEISKIFVEVVIAPRIHAEAAEVLSSKSKLRLLEAAAPAGAEAGFDLRTVPGGLLAQHRDGRGFDRDGCRVVTRRPPDEPEWTQLELAWLAAKHVKSNAIVLACGDAAVGIGAGQMSRVEAVHLAVQRAGARARGAVMGSDAFFPFPDGIEEAARAGITAVIQPGGSVKDGDSIAAANAHGLAMVFTGERHFRH